MNYSKNCKRKWEIRCEISVVITRYHTNASLSVLKALLDHSYKISDKNINVCPYLSFCNKFLWA